MSLFGDEDIVYDDDLGDDEKLLDHIDIGTEDKLVEPKLMSFCSGHEAQEKLFLELFEKKSLPHAMIFSGSQGIGKATMAFRLARFLLKNGTEDSNQNGLFGGDDVQLNISSLNVMVDDPVFTRVASGGHADLLYIHRDFDSSKGKLDASLKVEALRKIEPFLRKTASHGGWRIVIVDDADTMNRNAQNAILKILEEPPSNVMIILIAHRPGMLIPTICSRSRVIQFSPLSNEVLNELLSKQGHVLSVSELDTLSALSEGSIGQALYFAEEGGLETLSLVLDHLDALPNWNWAKIHQLSMSLSAPSQDKEYRMFSELMQWVFRQVLFVKARGFSELPFYMQRDALQRTVENHSLDRLIAISDGLKDHFERVESTNLDRRDAIRGSFLVISE